jgi:predicted TIM-barrel fold metal-dependent hydrolase
MKSIKSKKGFGLFFSVVFYSLIFLSLTNLFYFFLDFQDSLSTEGYKKIDFHQHLYTSSQVEDYFKVMDLFNIEKSVVVSLRDINNSNVYKRNNGFVLQLQEDYPDRVIAYTTIEEEDENSLEVFREDVSKGSQGLKLIGWHSMYIKQYNVSLTDKKMYDLYEFSEEKGLPIIAHIRLSEPKGYYEDLAKISSDFPDLKIILAHGGLDLDNLQELDKLMEENPNLYIDLSFYGTYYPYWFRQVGEHHYEFRNLIIKYPDQVLWGTDLYPSISRGYDYMVSAIDCSVKLVEELTFTCPGFEDNETLTGLRLPSAVLKKIYYDNAVELLE